MEGIICKQTGKNIYSPKEIAETVLRDCKKKKREEKNIYHCAACDGWHLTKHELDEDVV